VEEGTLSQSYGRPRGFLVTAGRSMTENEFPPDLGIEDPSLQRSRSGENPPFLELTLHLVYKRDGSNVLQRRVQGQPLEKDLVARNSSLGALESPGHRI